ncbi:MAG: proline--tRNA ligase [Holophagales bacterium]|jgi:prolyl-tRNA synthetase|nr:proline--tRNA ligase [Holophagales bacterium]
MKQSRALIHTLREVPKDADVISQQLMMRAGMILKLAAGIYDYLPLAHRSIQKLQQIVREELEADGCQELLMPAVQPAELWQESGRWQFYGKELLRFKDRKDGDFCLGPTHEEVITDIVRRTIKSYKQLPINLFQFQGKFRDEIRPRFGLMRCREFIMKDGYSFHINNEDADREYWVMFNAYKRIFSRVGVKFRPVEADSGAIGGSFTHEFHVLAGSGEDAILSCDSCDYTSNMEKTEAPQLPWAYPQEAEHPLMKAHFSTPGIIAMEEQARAFKDENHDGLPLDHASKFYLCRAVKGENTRDVGLVIRSDHEPNLVKLRNLLIADSMELVPLEEAERLSGAKSGFIGPVELDVPMYADRSLEGAYNLTCGANKTDYHHFGFKPDRDLKQFKGFFDLRMAIEGDACPRCKSGRFQAFRGIEVGQVFKLGTKYSASMGCTYLDADGKAIPMVMGCYGLGVTRTISAVIEQNYDADGIIWPWPVAPYHVHLLCLDPANSEILNVAENLEKTLESNGIETLLDDREGLTAGVRFKDADLLGFPLRVVVSAKGLKDGHVELRDRRTKEMIIVKPEELLNAVMETRERDKRKRPENT